MVGYEPKYTMRLPVHRERGNGGRSLDPHCDSLSLMRLAYFDCFSGISGDMALGALVHAGAFRAHEDVGDIRMVPTVRRPR